MAANRLSYFFDLSGPSMSIDTACSSAMAALHQAVQALQHGDSKMALVCGAKLILDPDMFMPSSELGFLSPSGKCQSFDAAGDGYGYGEGVLAILLKPLREAITDGDPVRSVIKGSANFNHRRCRIKTKYRRGAMRSTKSTHFSVCHEVKTVNSGPGDC